ncbi:MAG: hypothetical protein QI197_03180 [Candidatus Korarchaeota archaeon]|nr:hypothetical protein [Candidatus Korarchaeota archaeon]
MEEEVGGAEEEGEIIVLVSPICEPSLDAARRLKEWAHRRGLKIREVSTLEPEGQSYILELGIRKIPAIIIRGKLISEGRIELPEVS